MQAGIIYKATNITNNKCYIGQTMNFKERKKRHIGAFNKKEYFNNKFYRAIRKYGKDNFQWEIIYKNIPREYLVLMEKFVITNYDSYENGYNSTSGGAGSYGVPCSIVIKQKLSKANLGKVLSEETKQKISNSLKGIKRSIETREKISKANTGRHNSEEAKLRMSKSHTGKKLSEEHKMKISESNIGKHTMTATNRTIAAKKGWLKRKLSLKEQGKGSNKSVLETKKERIPWNKGLTKYTDSRVKIGYWKGKNMPIEARQKMADRLKGKKRGSYRKREKGIFVKNLEAL